MDRPFDKLEVDDIHFATERVKQWLASAEEAVFDQKRFERRKKAKCVLCFYRKSGRIGGAAITNSPCRICAEVMTFSSTATDALCVKCATENDLCCECGCDLQLRRRRKVELAK